MKNEYIFGVNNRKRKTAALVLGLFSLIGIITIWKADTLSESNEEILNIILIGFFIFVISFFLSVYLIYKIRKSPPYYFKINDIGFEDRSDKLGYGLIKWSDIEDLKFNQMDGNKCIFIYVKNSDKFINRTKNLIAKEAMKITLKEFKTPIIINAELIDHDLNELPELLKKNFEIYSIKSV